MAVVKNITARWAARLAQCGVSRETVSEWCTLRSAITAHQELLRAEGIGVFVSERDRVRVNARRVGLEAPAFADELDFGRDQGSSAVVRVTQLNQAAAASTDAKQ